MMNTEKIHIEAEKKYMHTAIDGRKKLYTGLVI